VKTITVQIDNPIEPHFEQIERLHRRLALFLGDVWSEQLIIALHNISKTSERSYRDLLEEAAEIVTLVTSR